MDPDGWHAAALSSEEIKALRGTVRTKCPNVQNCIGADDRLQPWRYGAGVGHKPNGSISFVGENFSFLDAGDYDADGRSELLFLISGYNRGGYALLFDDFKRSAIFEFSYH